jgi:hypothetical protein
MAPVYRLIYHAGAKGMRPVPTPKIQFPREVKAGDRIVFPNAVPLQVTRVEPGLTGDHEHVVIKEKFYDPSDSTAQAYFVAKVLFPQLLTKTKLRSEGVRMLNNSITIDSNI